MCRPSALGPFSAVRRGSRQRFQPDMKGSIARPYSYTRPLFSGQRRSRPLESMRAPGGPCHEAGCLGAQQGNRLVGAPHRIGDEAEVDEGGEIAVALRNLGAGDGVLHYCNLETLFQQLAQM